MSNKIIAALFALTFLSLPPAPLFAQEKQAKPAPEAAAAKAETAWARRAFTNPTRASLQTLRDIVAAIAAEHAGILGVQPRDIDIQALVGVDFREGDTNDPPSQFQITVHAHQPEVKNRRALEFLDAITKSLALRLEERVADRFGVERGRRAVDEAERSLENARQRVAEFEAIIRDKTGRVDASLEPIRAAVPKLEEQRQAIKLEVIGKQARQEALAQAIERLAQAAEKRSVADPVAAELEKVVNAREAALDRLKQLRKSNDISEAELVGAEVPVAEARAKLLERRETVAQSNGGELLSGLNRELATLSIDVAEADAKLAALEKTLAQYGSVQDVLSEAQEARKELDRASNEAHDVRGEWREMRRNMPESVLETVRTDTMAPDDPRLQDAGTGPFGSPPGQ